MPLHRDNPYAQQIRRAPNYGNYSGRSNFINPNKNKNIFLNNNNNNNNNNRNTNNYNNNKNNKNNNKRKPKYQKKKKNLPQSQPISNKEFQNQNKEFLYSQNNNQNNKQQKNKNKKRNNKKQSINKNANQSTILKNPNPIKPMGNFEIDVDLSDFIDPNDSECSHIELASHECNCNNDNCNGNCNKNKNNNEQKNDIAITTNNKNKSKNKNKNGSNIIHNYKSKADRNTLQFDRATESWFDINDPLYRIKKSFNNIARSNYNDWTNNPKIIIKNCDYYNWSYSEVFMALEQMVMEMDNIGNKNWNLLNDKDIMDYRINLPKLPKFNIKNVSRLPKKNMNENKNNQDDDDDEPLDILVSEIEYPKGHPFNLQKDWNNETKLEVLLKSWEDWDNEIYENKRSLLSSFKKEFNNINQSLNKVKRSKSRYKYNPYTKLRRFDKHIPIKINSRKFDKPTLKYYEYERDNNSDQYMRKENSKRSKLDDYPYIEFILNKECDFIKNNDNWAQMLMFKFHNYKGVHFGKNMEMGFFEPYNSYEINISVPHQILRGYDWNVKVADFIHDAMLTVDNNFDKIDYKKLLAVRKWGKKYPNRVSCYIEGSQPPNLPKTIKWRFSQPINIDVANSKISPTQERAMKIPKCWACFTIGHNFYNCPIVGKERTKYNFKINKRTDLNNKQKRELISNWKYKPNKCTKCGQIGHTFNECKNDSYCVQCNEFGHNSGSKSIQCPKLIQFAIVSLKFDRFYQKCINYRSDIPSPPAFNEKIELNIPWEPTHSYDKFNHKWNEIDNWYDKWSQILQNQNMEVPPIIPFKQQNIQQQQLIPQLEKKSDEINPKMEKELDLHQQQLQHAQQEQREIQSLIDKQKHQMEEDRRQFEIEKQQRLQQDRFERNQLNSSIDKMKIEIQQLEAQRNRAIEQERHSKIQYEKQLKQQKELELKIVKQQQLYNKQLQQQQRLMNKRKYTDIREVDEINTITPDKTLIKKRHIQKKQKNDSAFGAKTHSSMADLIDDSDTDNTNYKTPTKISKQRSGLMKRLNNRNNNNNNNNKNDDHEDGQIHSEDSI